MSLPDFAIRVTSALCSSSVQRGVINSARYVAVGMPPAAVLVLENVVPPGYSEPGSLYAVVTSVMGNRDVGIVSVTATLNYVRRGMYIETLGTATVVYDLWRNGGAVRPQIAVTLTRYGGFYYTYECGEPLSTDLVSILNNLAGVLTARAPAPAQPPPPQPPQWWAPYTPPYMPPPYARPSVGDIVRKTIEDLFTVTTATMPTEYELEEARALREEAKRIVARTIRAVETATCLDMWKYKPTRANLLTNAPRVVSCMFELGGSLYTCAGDRSGSPLCITAHTISLVAARVAKSYYNIEISPGMPAFYASERALKDPKEFTQYETSDALKKAYSEGRYDELNKVMENTERRCGIAKGHIGNRNLVASNAFVIAYMLNELYLNPGDVDKIVDEFMKMGYHATVRMMVVPYISDVTDDEIQMYVTDVLNSAASIFGRGKVRKAERSRAVVGAYVAQVAETVTLSEKALCTILGIAAAYPKD